MRPKQYFPEINIAVHIWFRVQCEEDGQDFAEYALILGITYENHRFRKQQVIPSEHRGDGDVDADDPHAAYISCSQTCNCIHDISHAGQVLFGYVVDEVTCSID